MGCVTDSSTRVLTSSSTTSPNMTISTCQSFCLVSDYPFAGLEYASQCFYRHSLASNISSTTYKMAYAGNTSQICHGGFRVGSVRLHEVHCSVCRLLRKSGITATRTAGWTDKVQGGGREFEGVQFHQHDGYDEGGLREGLSSDRVRLEYRQECEHQIERTRLVGIV
jgi:hypothetical protein